MMNADDMANMKRERERETRRYMSNVIDLFERIWLDLT